MQRIFRRRSYRMRISIVITLFALIPLSLFGVYYLKNEWEGWQISTVERYSQMFAAGSEYLDKEVQEIQSKLVYVSNVYSIRKGLSGIRDMNLIEGLELVTLLRDTVTAISVGNNNLVVRWYVNQSKNYGGYTYTFENLKQELGEEEALYDEIMSLSAEKIYRVVREINRENNNKDKPETRFCVYTKITGRREMNGLLEMSIPFEELIDIREWDLPVGSVLGLYLELDSGGQTFLLSADTETAEGVLEEYHRTGICRGYYPIVSKINSFTNSQMTCLVPKDYVMEQMSDNVISYAVIVLLFLLTMVFCSYAASVMLTRRVVQFIEKMNSELDNLLEGSSMVNGDDSDIRSIESRIQKLMQSTREYYARLEQMEAEKNRLELEILQMRINPHFLYNTLTSIRYQIKEARVRKSIDSLIHYYRIVLSNGHLVISIAEEMAMIREYLELQVFAYRLKNIKYMIEVDEEVKKYTIIKHLLQPIVENALEHGLRSNDETGIIWIRSRLDEGDIIFEIEDNGVGMSQEQIVHILSEPEGGSNGGYGIYNVQQRIETYYGKDYGVIFHSKLGEGTCVMLRIPQKVMLDY